MKDQISKCGNYKKSGSSLYELKDGHWHHVALLPPNIKTVSGAVLLFVEMELS